MCVCVGGGGGGGGGEEEERIDVCIQGRVDMLKAKESDCSNMQHDGVGCKV